MKKATTKQPKTATPASATPADIITAETVVTMGERIAIKAMKTNLQAGGNADTAEKNSQNGKPTANGNFNFLYGLYCGLVADVHNRQNNNPAPFSDGYDIAQTASAFLCGYIGKRLNDTADNGETDKDGKPITILRATFRAVNRYIMGERRREYKRAYVDETDENGKIVYYEIPLEWDTPTATDFKRVTEIINALNLTDKQAQILRYRLRGIAVDTTETKKGQDTPRATSIHTIARKMGMSRQAVLKHLQAIQTKLRKYAETDSTTAETLARYDKHNAKRANA